MAPCRLLYYFYSRASCEARRVTFYIVAPVCEFLLTRLMRGAARIILTVASTQTISTHAPHARRGCCDNPNDNCFCPFLLTRLMRGAAKILDMILHWSSFLLTRLMRGAAATRTVAIRTKKFLLTRLMRGAAKPRSKQNQQGQFLLTRLMRGAA